VTGFCCLWTRFITTSTVYSFQLPYQETGVIYQSGQFDWTRKHRHYTLEDLQRAQKIMTNRYERGQGSSPQKWRMAMEIAERSLQQGYQPKNNYLYFRASGGKNKFYGNAKHFKRIRH
ncbi:cell wall hydrolase, partial [Herbiconiux daphne]